MRGDGAGGLLHRFRYEESASYAAALAREYAPVDTGWLKSNIRKVGNYVYSAADYSIYVNYGSLFTIANPFFTRAVEEATREMEGSISKATLSLSYLLRHFGD